MSKVEQLIQELCPGGVEYKPLKEIGTLIRGNGLQKSDFIDFGYGCIHYGQIYTRFGMFTDKVLSYVSDELAQKLTKVEPGNVILACTSENVEDVCKSVVWLGNKTIVTGGHATVFRHNQNPKYIGYCLNTENFFNQKRKYAYGAKVIDIKIDKLGLIQIPLPPLSIQQEIVRILDTFTEAQANLEQELELRKKQYEYYRNQLLTFDENDPSVKWMKLDELSIECYSGATPSTKEKSYWESGTIPWMSSGDIHQGQIRNIKGRITQSGYDSCSTKMVPINSIVIALAGQGKTRGSVAITRTLLCTNQSLCAVIPETSLVFPDYLYYYLKGEYKNLRKVSSGDGTRGGLNLKMIKNYQIFVPSFGEQQEIVSILDKFESAIQTLEEELALRKKQYEYYREKLLTFKYN